jgi:ribosome-associated protein
MSTCSLRCESTDSGAGSSARRPLVVTIMTSEIAVGDFLKWAGVAATGGRAKALVQGGGVMVNGGAERRRGRRLVPGDRVQVGGREYLVAAR